MADKPTLHLTNGSAQRLAQLIATSGLLTNPDELFPVGRFAEDHLCDLATPPVQPGQDGRPQDWVEFNASYKAWSAIELQPIETTVKRRNGLKALLKSACDKGQISGTKSDVRLLSELGLAGDE